MDGMRISTGCIVVGSGHSMLGLGHSLVVNTLHSSHSTKGCHFHRSIPATGSGRTIVAADRTIIVAAHTEGRSTATNLVAK